jgi:polyhydroxyalkanoate synthesis regulator phasin
MIDTIKKAMLAGIGAAVVTTEKMEEALSELVEKGKLSAEDAKTTASKLADDGRREFDKASEDLQSTFKDLMEKAGMGQNEKIKSLEKRLLALEVEVANLVSHSGNENKR